MILEDAQSLRVWLGGAQRRYSRQVPEYQPGRRPRQGAECISQAESGSVTITRAKAGRISGRFELEARGFVAKNLDDEDQWVTVSGQFEAQGDSTIVALRSAPASVQ